MVALETNTTMVSRSTQTDPEPAPFPGHSFARNAPEDSWLEEPLGHTAIDPYGRRSMAYRRKATGEIVTQTELDEATIEDQPMRNFFRRQDAYMCFMMMEDIKSPRLRSFLQFLDLALLMVPWLVYNNLMCQWETKMEERRKKTQDGEKER
ncbi:hypothetical protein Q7P35_010944 [Cladosporium inversicolor]